MPTALIVCGSPGAGKTTYGKALAAKRGAALLDIDTVTERLVKVALREAGHDENDRDSRYFKRTFRAPIYHTLFDMARENLRWTDVVIVGPFTREVRQTAWPAQLGTMLNAPIEVHYVYCNPAERKARLQQRNNPRDVQKLADWNSYSVYYGDEAPPAFDHVFIDTSTSG